jgi:hypothetical protein
VEVLRAEEVVESERRQSEEHQEAGR